MKKSLFIVIGLSFWTFLAEDAIAEVPPLIPVQGVLTDSGGEVLDGDQNLTFKIYDSFTTTTALWTETKTDVPVEDGFFSVYLGDDVTLPVEVFVDSAELWLSMSVDTEELSRIRLASVPFAIESQVCRQVGSLYEEDIQPILSGENGCDTDEFLQGWDPDAGVPRCAPGPEEIEVTDWSSVGIVYTSPYTDSGSYASHIEYRRMGNMVFLRGTGNAGSTHVQDGQTICTLPVGFRPPSGISFLALHRFPNEDSGVAEVYLSSSGVISISNLLSGADKQFIYFDSVSYGID